MAQKDTTKLKSPTVFKRSNLDRDIRSAVRLETAQEAIGEIPPGAEIYGFTKGQFCIINVIEHCLKQIGPADVVICTWSAASGDIRAASRLCAENAIKSLKFIVDFSFKSRKPEFCQELADTFGGDCIRVTSCHAKFVTMKSATHSLVIRTSMNLNYNPRFENFEISDDARLHLFMSEIVAEIWATQAPMEGLSNRPYDNRVGFDRLYRGQGLQQTDIMSLCPAKAPPKNKG